MKKFILTSILFLQIFVAFSQREAANPNYILGEFIVKIDKNVTIQNVVFDLKKSFPDCFLKDSVPTFGIWLVAFDPTRSAEKDFLKALQSNKNVTYADYNHRVEERAANKEPNDGDYDRQWNVRKVQAPKVWDVTTGGVTALGDTIVVAVMEVLGCDISNNEIKNNIWFNRKEIPNNGIDDDQNGYIDDFRGWNVTSLNDSYIVRSHGTNVASVIGATGNNGNGVAGVNWNVKMSILAGIGDKFKIAKAYEYIFKMRKLYNQTNGARGAYIVVSNASLGISPANLAEAISDCQLLVNPIYDSLGKVGVLNITATANASINVDTDGDIMGNCNRKYMISVTNSDSLDKKYSGAAFGKNSIDMTAPGTSIYLADVNNSYSTYSGTSFAAPLVSGGVALFYSLPSVAFAKYAKDFPEEATRMMRDVILNGVDKIPALEPLVTTGGRLNLAKSFKILTDQYGGSVGALDIQNLFPNPASTYLTLLYETPDFKPYNVAIFNVLGQLVQQEVLNPPFTGKKTATFDVSRLAQGLYFLSINDGNKYKSVHKFVIQ